MYFTIHLNCKFKVNRSKSFFSATLIPNEMYIICFNPRWSDFQLYQKYTWWLMINCKLYTQHQARPDNITMSSLFVITEYHFGFEGFRNRTSQPCSHTEELGASRRVTLPIYTLMRYQFEKRYKSFWKEFDSFFWIIQPCVHPSR